MCILCVIQKWSRRVATMLPWLVIPLIGLWALSQLLPPAFRFEITSPRLACVFVLLITLFWYEVLMPQLSAWRVRRNALLRERKRFEAIEMQKLRKTATRRCRNCLTPYRDQNPGGGRFMCSYCGHISKRPVLDLPPGLGLSNSGILKDLVGKGGKILNGKAWTDNGWMCGQDWLDNGSWAAGPFAGKSSHWRKNGGVFFGGDDHCLAEKSYSHVVIFACKVLTAFFLSIMWLWRKIFRISSPGDDALVDAEHRGLAKGGENGGNCHESRVEKARRKAEEKRQARLEKEQLEEEEKKQREEVARLVEERRKLRDDKMEVEKDRSKGSPSVTEKDRRKEAEKKRKERKKEKDRGSSKSNSDVEEMERRAGKGSERISKSEADRGEHHKTGAESVKSHITEMGHGFTGAIGNNHNRGNAGIRYLDRMRGTFLSSSRALTGGNFFGNGANTSATVSREHKCNNSVDHVQAPINRREFSQPDQVSGKLNINGDNRNINHPVLTESQSYTTPKRSWQQLFTRSAVVPPPCNSNVISRPNVKPQPEVQSPSFSGHKPSTQLYDNPINFGLPSPFTLSNFSYGSTSSSTTGLKLSSESMFPKIGEAPCEFLPAESDIFEDPCYVPDPVSLLGPVSESLNNFQLDLGSEPCAIKNIHVSSDVNRPSPIESPLSRLRESDERHASFFHFQNTPKVQDMQNMPVDALSNANEKGTWQMWNTSPLGQNGLGFVGGPPSWLVPPELSRSNKEDTGHAVPQKTMASLFKKDDQVLFGTQSPQKGVLGSCQNGGTYSTPVPGITDDPWLPNDLFGPMSGSLNNFSKNSQEGVTQNERIYGSPSGSTNDPFQMSPAKSWAKTERTAPGSGDDGIGNSPVTRHPIGGGLYSTPDVQSIW